MADMMICHSHPGLRQSSVVHDRLAKGKETWVTCSLSVFLSFCWSIHRGNSCNSLTISWYMSCNSPLQFTHLMMEPCKFLKRGQNITLLPAYISLKKQCKHAESVKQRRKQDRQCYMPLVQISLSNCLQFLKQTQLSSVSAFRSSVQNAVR